MNTTQDIECMKQKIAVNPERITIDIRLRVALEIAVSTIPISYEKNDLGDFHILNFAEMDQYITRVLNNSQLLPFYGDIPVCANGPFSLILDNGNLVFDFYFERKELFSFNYDEFEYQFENDYGIQIESIEITDNSPCYFSDDDDDDNDDDDNDDNDDNNDDNDDNI
ncbi:hypothetical protein Hokovirus_1_310 [Hokovirus HKV1]|uniref:Uncharacterized protein n=1 Tax=Hokovirus HKV1 TaxID=1977638 RepID=A0A1V0SFH2_9VIRU|nr:hypothetical protein Hokovirus_1_310 [Hokovirus HKV1]